MNYTKNTFSIEFVWKCSKEGNLEQNDIKNIKKPTTPYHVDVIFEEVDQELVGGGLNESQ